MTPLLAGLLGWLFMNVGFLTAAHFRPSALDKPTTRIISIFISWSGVAMFLGGVVTILAALTVGVIKL